MRARTINMDQFWHIREKHGFQFLIPFYYGTHFVSSGLISIDEDPFWCRCGLMRKRNGFLHGIAGNHVVWVWSRLEWDPDDGGRWAKMGENRKSVSDRQCLRLLIANPMVKRVEILFFHSCLYASIVRGFCCSSCWKLVRNTEPKRPHRGNEQSLDHPLGVQKVGFERFFSVGRHLVHQPCIIWVLYIAKVAVGVLFHPINNLLKK